jgi:hypothetical protein
MEAVMNKRKITLMVLVLAMAAVLQRGLIAQGVGYANYKNGRYGYELSYPPNLLHPQPESQSGDGRHFTSSDGSARLSCWGAVVHEGENIQTLYQRDLAAHPGSSYKVLRLDWFVISGETNGRIFYEKAVVREGSYAAFLFEYSRSAKRTYDPVVSWISKSFKYGGAASSNSAVAARVQSAVTWADPATGLTWARQDNGSNINWGSAGNYCRNLTLGGYSNWRLPTIDELQGIYVKGYGDAGVGSDNIKGGIRRTGYFLWSSSAGSASGEAWGFHFLVGNRYSIPRDNIDYDGRALCVRRSAK